MKYSYIIAWNPHKTPKFNNKFIKNTTQIGTKNKNLAILGKHSTDKNDKKDNHVKVSLTMTMTTEYFTFFICRFHYQLD